MIGEFLSALSSFGSGIGLVLLAAATVIGGVSLAFV